MTRRDRLWIFAALGLAAACALVAARVTGRLRGARLELGAARTSRLADATRRRLATLDDRVFLTYFVSDRSRMPSHMRGVERDVTDLLDAMKDASDGKFDYQIVDPDSDPDLATFASRHGAAPFRARSVERDSYDERTVWSTLTIAYGTRKETAIPAIGPEHVPRLQTLLALHLSEMESPRRPTVVVAAPAGYSQFKTWLAKTATVAEVDFDGGEALPADADLFVWLEPRRADDAALRALDEWTARGRGVVFAGSEHVGRIASADTAPLFDFKPTSYPARTLFAHFGLRPIEGLVLDDRSLEGKLLGKPASIPFFVDCIALDQDFRTMKGQPNGDIAFAAPTPIAASPGDPAAREFTIDVLATTSDASRILDLPAGPVAPAALAGGEPVAKQPLIVRLRPRDPWHGAVVALAAPTPFQDGWFDREGSAHERLAKTLVDDFTSPERLVVDRVGVLHGAPLPSLSGGSRLFWRTIVVFLLAAALAAFGIARRGFDFATLRIRAAGFARRPIVVAAGTSLVVGLAARAFAGGGLRVDLTADRLGRPADETRAIASRAKVAAELVFTGREGLPAYMRTWEKRVSAALDDLRRAGASVAMTRVDPSDLGDAERKALADSGVVPFQTTTREDESTTTRSVYAALRLTSGPRSELLRFEDREAMENLEFRLTSALRRLETGRRPRIAFASDVPRPSPAEAYEDFKRGLVSPVGVDVYGLARRVLETNDFDVMHVNPRKPAMPADCDALVWLQPRHDATAMYELLATYLHGGGRALLAVQNYNIQARQYRGASFKLVYWPQPQFPDFDQLWFPELGIEVVPEILFDESKTRMTAETQVNRATTRPEIDAQTSALPFVIRAPAANFATSSPITKGLGDQAFVWGSYLRWDADKLARLGLRATPIVETSPRTWTFAWKGRWIPDESLAGPPIGADGRPEYMGRLALAAVFDGQFPLPAGKLHLSGKGFPLSVAPELKDMQGAEELLQGAHDDAPEKKDEAPAAHPAPRPAAPGELVLVGCSEMFKDARLLNPEFRADHLLLNAVAHLSLEPDLAAIASRRRVARGFEPVESTERVRWRAAAVALFPAALLVFGLVRALIGRLATRRPA